MYMPTIIIKEEKMDILLYILIFIIGTLFGSFYTLAVYRIPKRQDITHTHSYCPNCNHKLGILDLVPIFSYIFLGGKCRYCKQKIRPRYLILEILSGILFLLMAIFMNLKMEQLEMIKIAQFCFMVLYITFIILICGIDKETKKMDKLVLIYGVVISIIYMIYLCIVEKANIYRYVIYSIIYVILLTIYRIILKKNLKNSYVVEILLMVITMVVFTGEYITAISINYALLVIAIYLLIKKIKTKDEKQKEDNIQNKIPIGFYLGISNLIWTVFLFFYNYIS